MPDTNLKDAIRGYLQNNFPNNWQYCCLVINLGGGLPAETLLIVPEIPVKTCQISQRLFCSFPSESSPTQQPQSESELER